MKSLKTADIVIIPVFAVILTLQEELLTFIPNVSLTVFLIVLYSRVFRTHRTMLLLVVYVFLDSLLMGSINPLFIPFTYLGWSLIPLCLNTIFKGASKSVQLAFLGVLFSFLYCWIYIIPNLMVMGINLKAYLAADLPFELTLAATSFLTILWLYEPCYKVLNDLYYKSEKNN